MQANRQPGKPVDVTHATTCLLVTERLVVAGQGVAQALAGLGGGLRLPRRHSVCVQQVQHTFGQDALSVS